VSIDATDRSRIEEDFAVTRTPLKRDVTLGSGPVNNRRGLETQERLLRAAFRVAAEEGITGLSLDAVAKAAGTSKGGLLHHFPSKMSLIEAMISYTLSSFEAKVAAVAEATPEAPGRSARAYLKVSLERMDDENEGAALLMIQATPRFGGLWREHMKAWTDEWIAEDKRDGSSPVDALIVRLAADGLWIRRLLGEDPLPLAMQNRIAQRLQEMTRT
jgi:AcrR family transcriptional regulator